ncbi:amine oxidase-like protein [Dinothrombium tinctorium]|uniref:Amine oxidase n=1 Tax=Dinothrombium tinctorium TaxID=1965070 RepID=A0A3S3NVH4_9ACAR|nr:amine oxidase-like protein [Dinothrombium tinctorium]
MLASNTGDIHDVIIIGAGISGLSAAKHLKESNFENILILEAKDRIGGRIYTKRSSKVNWVDLGASYIGPNQVNILRIAKQFEIKTYKVFSDGLSIDYVEGKRTVYTSNGLGYDSEILNTDLKNFLQLLDDMGKEVPLEAPWLCAKAKEWDEMTYKEFIEKTCRVRSVKEKAYSISTDLFSADAYELSLLFVLWYIKMGGGTYSLFSNENGAQERKIDGGAMQICEKIVEYLGVQKVMLNKAVYSIKSENNYELIKTLDGCEFKSRNVILAIPPCVQAKIHFSPALPALRNQMLQRFPMGCVMKCILYYNKPFWRENGFCGVSTIPSLEFSATQGTYDDSKPNGEYPSLMGFVFAKKNRELYQLDVSDRKERLCQSLARIFECKEALTPIHYEEYNWAEDQYCGGGYSGLCPPGFLTRYGATIREPVGRIHFAGTETAKIWYGYMDGAIEAGERAALEVISCLNNSN